MSYILDALKKAEQEREQGAVPGLHAQQVLTGDAPATPAGLSPLAWAGIGVALTLAGVLTWHNWPQPPGAVTETVGTRAMDGPGQPPAPPPRPSATVQAPQQAPTAQQPPDGGVGMQVDGGPQPGTSRPWPAQPALSVPAGHGGEQASGHTKPRAPEPEAAAAALATLPRLADLPDALRKELPALSVGGAMHSTVPSQRMLVLNGQVLHEGDSPQAGLQLEEIRLKSAVLNFRGQRFELQY
jgi:general secretion pathway protein B